MKGKKGVKGFTLVELMVVVVIIGILAAIAIPMYSSYTDKANKKAAAGDLKGLQTTLETYYAEKSDVPDTADIGGAVTDWTAKYSDNYTYKKIGTHDYEFKSKKKFSGVYVYIDEYGAIVETTS